MAAEGVTRPSAEALAVVPTGVLGRFWPNQANLSTIRDIAAGFGAKGAEIWSGDGVGPGPQGSCREAGSTPFTIQITEIGEEVWVLSCVYVDGMGLVHRGIDQCLTDLVTGRGISRLYAQPNASFFARVPAAS